MEAWNNAYEAAEQYILDIPKFTSKNGLEDTQLFLEVLGNPEEDRKIIHVAGTNGKGSVCAYLDSVLREAGYSTGMFISPHLVEMRERFVIHGEPVSKERFVWAFRFVMDRLEEMRRRSGKAEYHPTFFELLFLMGMVIFREEDTEYIMLETGLGGRLDATNAVKTPVLTVLTEIGMDHMKYLGNTIEEIAGEKAGIMKPGVPVVFCDKRREAALVIEKKAKKLGNRWVAVREEEGIQRNLTKKGIDFSMFSRYDKYIRLHLRTKALYQIENALLAVRAIEMLPDAAHITKEQVEAGIGKTCWEGRMEEILPGVYVDGAHNEDGIRAFVRTVEADGCAGKRYLLFSAVSDKDYAAMADILSEKRLFRQIAVTRIHDERAVEPETLRRLFDIAGGASCRAEEETEEALNRFLTQKDEDDYIYIAGSLYLVGEIKAMLRRKADD